MKTFLSIVILTLSLIYPASSTRHQLIQNFDFFTPQIPMGECYLKQKFILGWSSLTQMVIAVYPALTTKTLLSQKQCLFVNSNYQVEQQFFTKAKYGMLNVNYSTTINATGIVTVYLNKKQRFVLHPSFNKTTRISKIVKLLSTSSNTIILQGTQMYHPEFFQGYELLEVGIEQIEETPKITTASH